MVAMKKYYSFLTVLAIIAGTVSCQKSKEITPDFLENQVNTNLPKQITAVMADGTGKAVTKTAYDSDGSFTWLSSDQIRLIVCENLSTYSKIGYSTYSVSSLSDGDKTAVFTGLMDYVDGDYKSTGFAMYPASVLNRFSTPENHSYGAPWFTLARGGYVSGKLSDTILIGTHHGSDDNFKFYSAMSVLKITLNNIPGETARVKLCTADKITYPIDGDFKLTKDGEDVPSIEFLTAYSAYFNGYQAVDLSKEGFIESRDFYFNIPPADYPASTLSIVLERGDGTSIVTKTMSKTVSVAQNDCLVLPELNVMPFIISEHGFTPKLNYRKSSGQKLRFDVNTVALTSLNYNSSDWENGNRFTNANSGSYSIPVGSFTNGNGIYYLNYLVLTSDDTIPSSLSDANVLSYGYIPIGFLSSSTVKADLSAAGTTVSVSSNETGYVGDDGGPEALYDGADLYWHSRWYSGTHTYSPVYGIYIDIELGSPASPINSVFQVKYRVRHNNSNGKPHTIVYGYSNDGGSSWNTLNAISNATMTGAANGAWVTLPGVLVPEDITNLRIGITKSGSTGSDLTGGEGSTALSELELYYE